MPKIKPKAGDRVRVTRTDDSLIKKGHYGVIGGKIDNPIKPNGKLDVTFNYYNPYRDNGYVTASGGPVRIIDPKDLKFEERADAKFWKFKGLPTAGGGVDFIKKINVFSVSLKKDKRRIPVKKIGRT